MLFGINEFSNYINNNIFGTPVVLIMVGFYIYVIIKLLHDVIKDASYNLKIRRIELGRAKKESEDEQKYDQEFKEKGFIKKWKSKK